MVTLRSRGVEYARREVTNASSATNLLESSCLPLRDGLLCVRKATIITLPRPWRPLMYRRTAET
jgi:hypothetical protein